MVYRTDNKWLAFNAVEDKDENKEKNMKKAVNELFTFAAKVG
jgi:hypothetical protein